MDQTAIELNVNSTVGTKPVSPWIKQVFGYLVALVCLAWVFHDIHVERLWESFASIDWWLIAAAVFF